MNNVSELQEVISNWLEQERNPEDKDYLLRLRRDLLEDAGTDSLLLATELFESRLKFGTAGIRGPMRPGPNGINETVISQTAAGLANWLNKRRNRARKPLVVIGFDGRHSSDLFARKMGSVLSINGIKVFSLPSMLPTPILAFAVRELKADVGVMVTASHNVSRDNGVKVYLGGNSHGSQIVSPVDKEIESSIHEVVESASFSESSQSVGPVAVLDSSLVRDYLSKTLSSLALPPCRSPLSTVYTAMHGVGGETFLASMAAAGFPDPHIVEEQFDPDPDFPTVAFPNPEEKGALDLSFRKARSIGADLIIAHDPDADRLAVALPESSAPAEYRALTGNQVGAILGWHIAKKSQSSGKTGTLANSLVSSPVLGRIAYHFGLDHEETLTGFKYVSRVKNLIFGFEEALGYLVTPDVVRDKDGISAGLLMVSLAHTLAEEGRTLWDYLHDIEDNVGAFASGQVTIRLNPGVAGSTVTSALRKRKLLALGTHPVSRRDDFLKGFGDLPKVDILRYYLSDGTRVIARPSGTEPKVKVYIDTEGRTSQEAQSRLSEVESDINELINSL